MKKICKYIGSICMVVLLAFTMMPVVNAEEDTNNEKPKIEDLTFAAKSNFQGITASPNENGQIESEMLEIGLDEFTTARMNHQFLYLMDQTEFAGLYYEVSFKNLSPDVIELVDGNDEPQMIVSDHEVQIRGLKEGKATIECTITDREDPSITRQETIEITIINKATIIPGVVFFGGDPYDFANEKKLDTRYIYTAAPYNAGDGRIGGYYHTTFENLTPDMIEISSDQEGVWESADVIESVDSGENMHYGIKVKALKEGDAKIRYTHYDIKHPERTRTEVIDLTFIKHKEETNTSEKPKFEVSYTGSNDILKDQVILSDTLNMIQNSLASATINLSMKENVETITLPKEILQAAIDNHVALTVNVEMNGKTVTWKIPVTDQIMDINLAMNIVNTKDVEALKNTDGLVFAFNHSGMLPTGTTITTYVGDVFKAGEKVQLSYYNEESKKLEETKEYTVDANGNVTVFINHCSNYVLEKAVTKAKTVNTKQEQKTDDIIKQTSTDPRGFTISTVILISMAGGLVYLTKRNKAMK